MRKSGAKENLGYARGNNVGLNQVKTKYALVLNPDARLEKNCVNFFLNTANKFQDFWLIGPANNQSDLNVNSEEFDYYVDTFNKQINNQPETEVTFDIRTNDIKTIAI